MKQTTELSFDFDEEIFPTILVKEAYLDKL
jgi:hypothetical protein